MYFFFALNYRTLRIYPISLFTSNAQIVFMKYIYKDSYSITIRNQKQMIIPSVVPNFVTSAVKSYNGKSYNIKTMDSAFIANSDLENRVFRSVIADESGKLLSVAPLKSLPNEDFGKYLNTSEPSMLNLSSSRLRVTEIIEGTMINLFWNGDAWEIATKKNVGGDYFYFRNKYEGCEDLEQKSFRQMFFDCIGYNTLDQLVVNLQKNRCYSFVIQHPANHIVNNIKEPKAYLVDCYQIEDDRRDDNHDNYRFEHVDIYDYQFNVPTCVSLPRVFNCDVGLTKNLDAAFFDGHVDIKYILSTPDSVYDTEVLPNIKAALANPLNKHNIPGIMLVSVETGLRTAFYNTKYNEVKLLRGNNPNLHYQYLVLRKIKKVADFLRYFPQYRMHFNKFYEHFNLYATRIHKLYVNTHVLKIMAVNDIEDKRDKYHVEKLHYECYLPLIKKYKHACEVAGVDDLLTIKPKMTRTRVAEYLDSENVIAPF